MANKKDCEIDYEKVSIGLAKKLENMMKEDEEYFALLKAIDATSKYATLLSKNMMNMKKSDQIKALRLSAALGEVAKELCEKYSFSDEEESEGNNDR